MNFSTFCLLKEAIQSPDIIDLYILMSMPEPSDEAARFTRNEIMTKSSRSILDEIDNILLRELRHVDEEGELSEYTDAEYEMKDKHEDQSFRRAAFNEVKNFVRKYGVLPSKLESIIRLLSSVYGHEGGKRYLTAETNLNAINQKFGTHINHQNVVNMFKGLFYGGGGYGGPSWARIAEQAVILNRLVSNPTEFLKKLDRFVDFVHNNGAVANKFKGYQEGWLIYILDLKQHAINIRELIPYASKEVQKMFGDPTWRVMMRKIPGEGAATSFESYKTLIQKYIKAFANSGDGTDLINVGNIIQRIGYDEVIKILKHSVPFKILKKAHYYAADEDLYFDEENYTNPDLVADLMYKGQNAIIAAYRTHSETRPSEFRY